jgi:hypothetical protein
MNNVNTRELRERANTNAEQPKQERNSRSFSEFKLVL